MFLGVLTVLFFFTETIKHLFLGKRNDVWASVCTEFSNGDISCVGIYGSPGIFTSQNPGIMI